MIKSLSHHAYIIIGDVETREKLLEDLNKTHHIPAKGNTDFFDRLYETFTIADARELKDVHAMRPVVDVAKKVFVLTMNGITIEAQNSLLKLLEEPAEYAHFFIIIPSEHLLLPTVKSRVLVLSDKLNDRKTLIGASSFLKLTSAKRLEFIKNLLDDISKERKTNQDAIDFVNELEAEIRKSSTNKEDLKKSTVSFEAIDMTKTYMNDRAPSMKMLLEYLALNI